MDRADEKIMVSIRRREPLYEPLLKVSKILETGGVGNYLSLCNDCIADAELIDGEDVRIDFMNFPDMELTAAGVRICRKILERYVPGDIIADAHEALCEEKSVRAHINLFSQTLRQAKIGELVRVLIESDDARIRRFTVAEICQRNIFAKCFRKMQSAYYNILVRVKYRGLLSGIGRIAADVAAENCK